MAKHSKNNCGNSVFTYMERKMLKQKNIWGDVKERISQDNQKLFEQCSICLAFVINPVCCLKGRIFCKKCLLENFLHQKEEIKKLTQKYEEQQKEKQLKTYENKNKVIIAPEKYQLSKNHDLTNCFWNWEYFTPFVRGIKDKPKNELFCPACEKKHIMGSKEYINLNMEINNSEEKNKFICPICQKVLNIQKIVALKNCGHVFCSKCLDNICKGDQNCPSCNKKFIQSDKILLKFTGTPYSTHNKVLAEVYVPCYKY